MLHNIIEIFSYTFMLRALIVGILISLCASLLGVILVLKKYAMIGDGLSHVAFGALSIATVLQIAPLYFSLPIVILVSFTLLQVNDSSKIHGDGAIAVLSSGALAIGVCMLSISGANIDINNYLFGSILAIQTSDVIVSVPLAIFVLSMYIVFYRELFAVTFDEVFAQAIGIKTNRYLCLLAVLTSITIVIGMRLMGSLLISSFIIFPAITSMLVFKNFFSVTICSIFISIFSFCVGMIISYYIATPTGATIVCTNLVLLLLFYIVSFIKKA